MTVSPLAASVALVFRRRGAVPLTATEFRQVASFDLKWFPPRDAARLLEVAIANGLVQEDGGRLRPTFDVQRADVPVDFAPDAEVLETPRGTLPPASAAEPPLLERLAAEAGIAPEELAQLAKLEAERSQGLLTEETALLLAARRRGADVRAHAGR